MPNFIPYQTEQFTSFAPAALTAERLYAIDPAACANELPAGHGAGGKVDVRGGQAAGPAL